MYKMNLQFFAEPAAPEGPDANTSGTNSNSQPEPAAIDYEKIQQMLEETLAAKEDTALKAYFKQQGLSQEEAEQAMSAFKAQKAANTPDVGAIQTELTQAKEVAQKAQLENAATLQAVQLGVDAKKIPFVLKLADMSEVVDKNGKINEEALKGALNKVLEALPELKHQSQQSGFQFGVTRSNQQQLNQNDQLAAIFGNKK